MTFTAINTAAAAAAPIALNPINPAQNKAKIPSTVFVNGVPALVQNLIEETLRNGQSQTRISVTTDGNQVHLKADPNGIILYPSDDIAKINFTHFDGKVGFSCFPICENDKGEIAVIKRAGPNGFYYIQGGLIDEGESVWDAASRETDEELGKKDDEGKLLNPGELLSKDSPGIPLCAYESIFTGARNFHNIMLMLYARIHGCPVLENKPDHEVAERHWMLPSNLWLGHRSGTHKSKDSIRHGLAHLVEYKLSFMSEIQKNEYRSMREAALIIDDPLLFDLLFVENLRDALSIKEYLLKPEQKEQFREIRKGASIHDNEFVNFISYLESINEEPYKISEVVVSTATAMLTEARKLSLTVNREALEFLYTKNSELIQAHSDATK